MIKRIPGSIAILTLMPLVAGCVSQPAKESHDAATATTSAQPTERYGNAAESHSRSKAGTLSLSSATTAAETLKQAPSPLPAPKTESVNVPKERGSKTPRVVADTPTQKKVANKPTAKTQAFEIPTASPTARETEKTVAAPATASLVRNTEPRQAGRTPPATPTQTTEGVGAETRVDPRERPLAEPAIADEQDTHLAMVDKNTPDPNSMSTNLIDREQDLPIELPGGWILDLGRDRRDGATRCLVSSPAIPMFDGYEHTEIKLQVTLNSVLVETKSNIDPSYPAQGLSVDGRELVPFEAEPLSENMIHTLQPVQSAMAGGEQLTVALGFWPSWPVTETQQANLSLGGFKQAYAALQGCVAQQ